MKKYYKIQTTNYKKEIEKVNKMLVKAYVNYDGEEVCKLRDIRKGYREEIKKEVAKQIASMDISPDYEDTGDGVTPYEWHSAYLESMYNSGIPMNKAQTKALTLIRG